MTYEWHGRGIRGHCMRGVTDTIRTEFFPKYSYKSATHGIFEDRDTTEAKEGGRNALKLGRELDRQIDRAHRTGRLPTLEHGKRVIENIESRGWSIVDVQLAVADESIRLNTCIDVVAMDDKMLYLIELKTGYAGYKHRHTQYPMKILDIDDSPFNQHRVQAAVNEKLFRTTHSDLTDVQSEVWYVSPNDVECHIIPNNLISSEAMKALAQSKNETKRQRRNRRRRK